MKKQKLTREQENRLWDKLVSEIQQDVWDFEKAIAEGKVVMVKTRNRSKKSKVVKSDE